MGAGWMQAEGQRRMGAGRKERVYLCLEFGS